MKKKVMLFISIAFGVCLCIGLGIYFLLFHREYKQFNGSFDFVSRDFIKSYDNGDIVSVYISYETYSSVKIENVSFKIKYSDGLKFVKDDIINGGDITSYEVKNNKYDIKINSKSSINDTIGFKFEVLDKNKELYVSLQDIVLTDQNGVLYKIDGKKALLYESGSLYKCNNFDSKAFNGMSAIIYSRYDYSGNYKIECEETLLDVDNSYVPVSNLWHDSKVLYYKNGRYYLYDISKKKFVLETDKLFNAVDNPIYAESFVDKNGDEAKAFGVLVGDGQIYINLDKDEAYYEFNGGTSIIIKSLEREYSNYDVVKTNGKLIQFKWDYSSDDLFKLFNGEDYKVMKYNYSSCQVNNFNNIECYIDNENNTTTKVTLFNSNGKVLFDSDKEYFYFLNIDKWHIAYNFYYSNDSEIYFMDYDGNKLGYVEINFEGLQSLPFIYSIDEDTVNSCYDYKKDNGILNDYILVQYDEVLKVYKKNNNNQFIYFKNIDYCMH